MITIATLLWDANEESFDFSRMYSETWVERLYRGFARNLTQPFRFVCFSDIDREFTEPQIEQQQIRMDPPGYAACIEPYRLGEPMILVGLDTVITGNVDHLASYCLTASKIALPRDPFFHDKVCNGVALVPAGHEAIASRHHGENDMEYMRYQHGLGRIEVIDDLFPGHVVSFKGHAMDYGVGDARIVYFHGEKKPHELGHLDWIEEHWR